MFEAIFWLNLWCWVDRSRFFIPMAYQTNKLKHSRIHISGYRRDKPHSHEFSALTREFVDRMPLKSEGYGITGLAVHLFR